MYTIICILGIVYYMYVPGFEPMSSVFKSSKLPKSSQQQFLINYLTLYIKLYSLQKTLNL